MKDCNKCVYSTRDGGCTKWECDFKTVADIRENAIDECIVMLEKIMPPQPHLIKCKHYEMWKMKTTELRMLRDMLEHLKEQKQ